MLPRGGPEETGPARAVGLPGGGVSAGDHCGEKGYHHFPLPAAATSPAPRPADPAGARPAARARLVRLRETVRPHTGPLHREPALRAGREGGAEAVADAGRRGGRRRDRGPARTGRRRPWPAGDLGVPRRGPTTPTRRPSTLAAAPLPRSPCRWRPCAPDTTRRR
ncbi:hypothetical protein LT493_35380 [Streptomyces tricolor]|nr:hypothetical protein [Streptomyces tricolor]